MNMLHGNFEPLWILAAVIGYLLGNISPAIIIGKTYGIDIKKEGSGNAGTTNALRVLGKKAAIITLAVDILKGVAAALLGRYLGGEGLGALCGLLAFCGHIWPVFFLFKGGKGVATAFGVMVTINPLLGGTVLVVVLLTVLITRRVSAGSVIGAITCPIIVSVLSPEDLWWTIIMAVIVLYKHNANISRLMRGEEPKLNFSSKKAKKEES